jgi:hypothetical protein
LLLIDHPEEFREIVAGDIHHDHSVTAAEPLRVFLNGLLERVNVLTLYVNNLILYFVTSSAVEDDGVAGVFA